MQNPCPPFRSYPTPPDPALIAELRVRIQNLQGRVPPSSLAANPTPDPAAPRSAAACPLGVDAIDRTLPWGGLPRACLHEICPADRSAAAAGFCTFVLARLAGESGTVLWCRRGHGLHGPGLATFGLDPARMIVVRARTDKDVLWTLEEGLRSGAVVAVLGETAAVDQVPLRRLQLAARTGGVTGLLLRPSCPAPLPSPAATRWWVSAAASRSASGLAAGRPEPLLTTPGSPVTRWPLSTRWKLELRRCKAVATGPLPITKTFTAPASWLVEWNHEADRLSMAADLRHRPAEPAAGLRAAGSRPTD
jgi:protein ImuA